MSSIIVFSKLPGLGSSGDCSRRLRFLFFSSPSSSWARDIVCSAIRLLYYFGRSWTCWALSILGTGVALSPVFCAFGVLGLRRSVRSQIRAFLQLLASFYSRTRGLPFFRCLVHYMCLLGFRHFHVGGRRKSAHPQAAPLAPFLLPLLDAGVVAVQALCRRRCPCFGVIVIAGGACVNRPRRDPSCVA